MFVINSATISGNLTRDPELRSTQSGTSVCNFALAVNERVKKGDNWEDRPSFIEITAWGSLGEQIAKQLAKGSPAAIAGELRQDRWEAEDGSKRSKVYIVARAFFAPKVSSDSGGDSDVPPDTEGMAEQAAPDDSEIPFARPRIPELHLRCRNLFVGDRWLA